MNKSKRKTLTQAVTLAVCIVAATRIALAQAETSYSAAEAAKHVGEVATIVDRVDSFHRSKKDNVFLNMGGKYPKQEFTAFVPAANASEFADAQKYVGRSIAVSGKIQLYKGKPEIVVTSESQIREK